MMTKYQLALCFISILCSTFNHSAESINFKNTISPFLEQYCLNCHDDDVAKGDVELHHLEDVSIHNAPLWVRVWDQIAIKAMPPVEKKKIPFPNIQERLKVSNWITSELEIAMSSHGGFNKHNYPVKGNHLPHELLFGDLKNLGELEPSSSPARLWRIHPQEHLGRLYSLVKKLPSSEKLNQNSSKKKKKNKKSSSRGNLNLHVGARLPNVIYLGKERIIGTSGLGSTAINHQSDKVSSVLTHNNMHGFRDYPEFYSVNNAELDRIASLGRDVLNYLAHGPTAAPHQFVNSIKDVDKDKYPRTIFYKKDQIARPLTPIYDLIQSKKLDSKKLKDSITFLFKALTLRTPNSKELQLYESIVKDTVKTLGFESGVIAGLVSIFLDRDALFKSELVQYGRADSYGRVMLQGNELLTAVNGALSFIKPDSLLQEASDSGRLKTKSDVKRELTRILNSPDIEKPKLIQFFREYFDYDYALKINKDDKALETAGGKVRIFKPEMKRAVENTDALVKWVLSKDSQVIRELLTTDHVVMNVENGDWVYLDKHTPVRKSKLGTKPTKTPSAFMNHISKDYSPIQVNTGEKYSQKSLVKFTNHQRMGILTQPSWLIAHSDAMDNHAILRGKWVRERLLGGSVPDVPITVDAMLPDEPNATLRHRMRVTREEECWRCHSKMDPLGLPFEMFNHIARFREIEQGKKVDTSGEIIESGDKSLDGPVKNAFEMIERMAKSERVEQVFVRHAFRYWMGRNETIHDAPILQEAHRAYRENNGSMKALLVSLLTSDAFLYRKVKP